MVKINAGSDMSVERQLRDTTPFQNVVHGAYTFQKVLSFYFFLWV